MEAVEFALHKSLQSLKVELTIQSQYIQEAKSCITAVEEEAEGLQANYNSSDHILKALLEKVEDLENRSMRSNLRIIGVPESYNANDLLRLCSKAIPEALGLQSPCVVERAHCIGPLQQDRKGRGRLLPTKQIRHKYYSDFKTNES